jgi:lysophospholipase L1-like esterase
MNPIIKFYQRTIENVFTHLNAVAKPGSIVFLGDSITDFFRVNEFFPGVYVINRGISGDTTDGVLNRLAESVYELSPSKIFLMIGTNDLGNRAVPFSQYRPG